MKSTLHSLLASAALVTFSGLPASAAVLITQDVNAPTENVLRSAGDDSKGNLNWNGYGNPATATSTWRDVGQTFRAGGDARLEAFTYKLASFGTEAQGAAITIEIYETVTGGTAFSPETLVSTQQATLPTTLLADQYITFTLDEAVTLKEDLFYTVYLHFDTPGTTTGDSAVRRHLVFRTGSYTSAGNPLGVGSYFWLRSNPFSTAARGDAPMTSYFQGEMIPEPQSAPLALAAGTVLAGGWLWRRRR